MPEELTIRKSKWRLVCYTLFSCVMAIFILKELYNECSTFNIILSIIFLSLFGYLLNDLVKRKPEIILTTAGIYLRDAGFFNWDTIASFSTNDEGGESSNIKLVLHFRELEDKENYIQSLEVGKEELIELILRYKGNASVFYSGHK